MRVADLDRDMRDVVPTAGGPDSAFLFERMTERSLELLRSRGAARLLDVASGFGQDAISLTARGAWAVGAEPSRRMSALARLQAEHREDRATSWVRGWSHALPFRDRSFDGVLCKGSLDHFDRPLEAISEMARVTRRDGRVVLAIANFESIACRTARALDGARAQWMDRRHQRGRRHYDVPSDHFTRYELPLMREHASCSLELERVEGVSIGWGAPGWSRSLARLPTPLAQALLEGLDAIARRLPGLADVVVLVGRPRRA